jgi:hypothetical protein
MVRTIAIELLLADQLTRSSMSRRSYRAEIFADGFDVVRVAETVDTVPATAVELGPGLIRVWLLDWQRVEKAGRFEHLVEHRAQPGIQR